MQKKERLKPPRKNSQQPRDHRCAISPAPLATSCLPAGLKPPSRRTWRNGAAPAAHMDRRLRSGPAWSASDSAKAGGPTVALATAPSSGSSAGTRSSSMVGSTRRRDLPASARAPEEHVTARERRPEPRPRRNQGSREGRNRLSSESGWKGDDRSGGRNARGGVARLSKVQLSRPAPWKRGEGQDHPVSVVE